MEARTLNRNSFHFKLAEKLKVVSYEEKWNWETEKWETVLEPISVCAYVRNLILHSLLVLACIGFAIVLGIGAILVPIDIVLHFFGYAIFPKIMAVFGPAGVVTWCVAVAGAAVGLIAFSGHKFKEYLRKNRKPTKEEGFWHMVKTVHNEKICFKLK